jgi:hypothetical protein
MLAIKLKSREAKIHGAGSEISSTWHHGEQGEVEGCHRANGSVGCGALRHLTVIEAKQLTPINDKMKRWFRPFTPSNCMYQSSWQEER